MSDDAFTDDSAVRRLYTPAMLAELLGVNVSDVRNWQRRGWIVPVEQSHRLSRFDFSQVAIARQLAQLLAAGVTPRRLERRLAELRRRAPEIANPLAELTWQVDGGQILIRHEHGWIEPGGQLRMDFEALETSAEDDDRPVTLVSPAALLSRGKPAESAAPEQLAAWAAELEETGELSTAAEMYRAALAAGGPRADLCFQLAEVLYRLGDLPAARERYFMALELEEDYLEARVNLGCVLAELGQHELAIAAFQGALDCEEAYPDVHFHLARTLDDRQRPEEAQTHWRRFLELAPESPWADEAHERLGQSGE
jgi:tetratricopeptide (TPR) repeat protein